jgi:hypothetical protein
VSYGEVLGDKSTMYVSVTLHRGYLNVLCLFHLVCILYYGCFNLFCNVWMCALVCFVMCGCCDTGVVVLLICVLVFTVFCIVCIVFCIVSLIYILFLFVLSVLV